MQTIRRTASGGGIAALEIPAPVGKMVARIFHGG